MNIDRTSSVEEILCKEYLQKSIDEQNIELLLGSLDVSTVFLAVEGFEERSVGVVEWMAERNARVGGVFVGTYDQLVADNGKHRKRFADAASKICGSEAKFIRGAESATWVAEALSLIAANLVIVDITGISNRALFGVLDILSKSGKKVIITYSEAKEYRPTQAEWAALSNGPAEACSFSEGIDRQPWLFGHQHTSILVPRHEGFDAAGAPRALLAFLPFKSSRLGAILSNDEYSYCIYVAGNPRLTENRWRLDALKAINQELAKDSQIISMDTFGYRLAMEKLVNILFHETQLLSSYNVHMAILGSKLQTVGCWAVSCMIPSISVVSSIPAEYFPDAYSNGIGSIWQFPLTPVV